MRRPSVGRIDAAASASTRGQLARAVRRRRRRRVGPPTAPAPPGRSPETPIRRAATGRRASTRRRSTGTAPRARIASTSAAAACWYRPTVAVCGHVEHVELVVRNAATLGGRQFGGADVHAAVELHGVGVDDLAAEPLGDVECQRALAGAGRPDDGDRPHRHGVPRQRHADEVPDAVRRAAVQLARRRTAPVRPAPPAPGRPPGRRSRRAAGSARSASPPASASSRAACTGTDRGRSRRAPTG